MDPNQPVRVGWKRAAWLELRRMPLEESRRLQLPSSVEKLRFDMMSHAYALLEKHNLLYEDEIGCKNEVRQEMRQESMAPNTPQPTLIMLAYWSPENGVAYKNVVKEMVEWLDDKTREDPQRMYVEITAVENVMTIYYGIVSDRVLLDAWGSTSVSIQNILESFWATRGSFTCLALQKYGIDPEVNANPPTVYISMDYDSDETGWPDVATRIKELLNRQGWNHVHVHMEHNLGMTSEFD
ncbi:hypothetical protein FHETE_4393 [Fusarium heterosporum]|uniref:Uncharacterized protein n=1 Tax=Fusarium heterosporum TaxID=42747 RepID=A0A8H5WSG1_FUSHE|nr:hypothetical protein FHETE_4393 [Fusarium heterosporum]